MGWVITEHPDHEGFVVGLVPLEGGDGGQLREIGNAEQGTRRDVERIQAGCSCGWRSPHLVPERGEVSGTTTEGTSFSAPVPTYWPSLVYVAEADEGRCRFLWLEHVRGPDSGGAARMAG